MLTQILFPSTPMKTSEEHHHSTTVSGIRSIIAGTDKQVCKNTNKSMRYLVPAQVDRDFCCWTAIRRLKVDLSAFTDLEVPVYLFYSTISFIQTIIFLLGYYL
nr:uncharacterized protein LOC117275591 [Nicotiana tomentosiformis]